MGAAFSACACMAWGLIMHKRYKTIWETAEEWQQILEKMDAEIRFHPASLPALLQACAPEKDHPLWLLAQSMAESPALTPAQRIAHIPLPAELPSPLQSAFCRLLEALAAPNENWRRTALLETQALWRRETEKLHRQFLQKGPLWVKLSLLGGCALFILLC